jgi:hypothetical protein
MSFLPEDYKGVPSNSDYMKLQDGDNTIRILGSAIVGWMYWNIENRPVRSKKGWDVIPTDCQEDKEGNQKIQHFWAFPVWNHAEKKVMILEITQKTVQEPIKELADNPRWGDPKNYDIQITRRKDGGKTSYNVQALPPIAPVDPAIAEAYARKNINLEALFEGGDPFKAEAIAAERQSVVPTVTTETPVQTNPTVSKPMTEQEAADFIAS